MADTVPTVKILPSHESQGDFVEINEADYDPKVHTLLDADDAPAKKGKKSEAEAAPE